MIMFSCIFLFAFCHQVLTLRSYDIINSPERFKRNTDKASDDVDKVRAEIEKVIASIKSFSGEIQQHISEINIRRNKLSKETARIVAEQKELVDRRTDLQLKIDTLTHNITAAEKKILELEKSIKEQEPGRDAAKKKFDEIMEKLRKWMECIDKKCGVFRFPPFRQISTQRKVVHQLQERLNKTIAQRDAEEANRRNFINEKQTATEQLNETMKEEVKLSSVLFNTTELAEKVMTFQLDLTILHTNMKYLSTELEEWHKLGKEYYSESLETIHKPLKVISDYLNNKGGFVDDLLGWGIDIRGGTHSFYCNEAATIDKVLCNLAKERAELPEEIQTIENLTKSRQ